MNLFDQQIIHDLYNFSKNSPVFTQLMEICAANYFINGGLLACLLWFFWFDPRGDVARRRQRIVIIIYATFIAIIIGRLLTNIFPFRSRPLLDTTLANFYPNKLVATGPVFETSMPSDHAVMFFALATGFFLLSKRAGVLAFLYSLFVICFPRVYLGLHYPSDIVVGALIGIVIMCLFSMSFINKGITNKTMLFQEKYPAYFYALFFLITYQIGTMFESCRELAHFLFQTLLHVY